MLHDIVDIIRGLDDNILVVITVYADGLAPLNASTASGIVMAKSGSYMFTEKAFELVTKPIQ